MTIRCATRRRALTLVELMVCAAIAAILLLTAWATWEISCRETNTARVLGVCQREVFSALRRIEHEVMRAAVIQVPDPDYVMVPSVQLRVLKEGDSVRRAFRLVDGALIVDLKDEGVAPYEAFNGLSELSFSVLDAPTNSQVQIICTGTRNGHSVQMQTVALRRN